MMKNIDPTSTNPSVLHLQEILNSCSMHCFETKDHSKSEDAVSALVEFINCIHGAIVLDSEEDEGSKKLAMEILTELLCFISSPSLDQVVVDALSFELPKLVVKFASVSDKFCETAECVIDRLISICSPRDMLVVICELLDSPDEISNGPAYFAPLLSGLSKVFTCLQRRHFEHVKEALPAVLNVLQAVSSEFDDENKDSYIVCISRTINIAASIQEVCQKLVGKQKEQMRALLGLFVLQIMGLASSVLVRTDLCVPMMSQLSQFLAYCNLSYLNLVTGADVEALIVTLGEENEEYMSSFSLIKQGAFLSVIWGMIYDEVAKAADEDLAVVKYNLQNSQIKRWQLVGMLRYVLSSLDQPWKLKEHAIDFFLWIMEGNILLKCSKEYANCVPDDPNLCSTVQAIEVVIIYSPDAVLRKKAFTALKIVLADIPAHQRFDVLKASITNNNYSSMIAILVDLVKEEMLVENNQKFLPRNNGTVLANDKVCPSSPFWSKDVLELVEFVLRPPKGGPPSLPEECDAVLSALNLYRFILITESTGKTNYSGVLLENSLRKAYIDWFLPLQTLVSRIIISEENEEEEVDGGGSICALNLLQMVLARCIELVEEKLQ